MPATLSKSRFMPGLQCELKLWNDAYRRDLATKPSEQQQARFDLGSAVGVLTQPEPPAVEVGDHCFRPYDCPYFAHCSAGLAWPAHPITDLYRLSQRRRDELRAGGIETIAEIPADFPLTEIQARIREVVRTGSPWRSADLNRLLNDVAWPLYFLDFEAFAPAVPRYVGTRPYQAIPFQYSLHVQQELGGAWRDRRPSLGSTAHRAAACLPPGLPGQLFHQVGPPCPAARGRLVRPGDRRGHERGAGLRAGAG